MNAKQDFCENILGSKQPFWSNILGAKQDFCSNTLSVKRDLAMAGWASTDRGRGAALAEGRLEKKNPQSGSFFLVPQECPLIKYLSKHSDFGIITPLYYLSENITF